MSVVNSNPPKQKSAKILEILDQFHDLDNLPFTCGIAKLVELAKFTANTSPTYCGRLRLYLDEYITGCSNQDFKKLISYGLNLLSPAERDAIRAGTNNWHFKKIDPRFQSHHLEMIADEYADDRDFEGLIDSQPLLYRNRKLRIQTLVEIQHSYPIVAQRVTTILRKRDLSPAILRQRDLSPVRGVFTASNHDKRWRHPDDYSD